MTDEQLAALRALRTQRKSMAEVAATLGISRQGVQQYVTRTGMGWPCTECGYDAGSGTVVHSTTCPLCHALDEIGVGEPDEVRGRCEYPGCRRAAATQRSAYCADHRRRRRIESVIKAQRTRAQGLRQKASRQSEPWGRYEDALLYAPGLSAPQVAEILNRTLPAILSRRRKLGGSRGSSPAAP